MSTGKEELEVEEDFAVVDSDEVVEPVVEVAKTNLAKRRTIDALLE
ncbi:PA3496 family putative envelope integrity protein [Pseudomonas bubulae]